jgi:hypothetical protein
MRFHAPQFVIRAHNVDGMTDRYYGGQDDRFGSLWVPISQAVKFYTKSAAGRVAVRFTSVSVERLTVTGSVPIVGWGRKE